MASRHSASSSSRGNGQAKTEYSVGQPQESPGRPLSTLHRHQAKRSNHKHHLSASKIKLLGPDRMMGTPAKRKQDAISFLGNALGKASQTQAKRYYSDYQWATSMAAKRHNSMRSMWCKSAASQPAGIANVSLTMGESVAGLRLPGT
jgi:hypothetical protein